MKWTVKLIAETCPGESVEHEVASIERTEVVSPATVGLTIAEGKAILESLQKQMIVVQIQHHGASISACPRCGRRFRTKGYYRSTLRSVYGNVRIRVRRIQGCLCSGSQRRSFSTLFTNRNPITPELKYLTAKIWTVVTSEPGTDDPNATLLPVTKEVAGKGIRIPDLRFCTKIWVRLVSPV
jgi:hypothetical protein